MQQGIQQRRKRGTNSRSTFCERGKVHERREKKAAAGEGGGAVPPADGGKPGESQGLRCAFNKRAM